MRKSYRVVLVIGAVLVALLLAFAVVYDRFWYGEIELASSIDYDRVLIDGIDYTAAVNNYPLRIRPGEHRVIAQSSTYEHLSVEVSVGFSSKSDVHLESAPIDMDLVVSGFVPAARAGEFKVKPGKFFEENTWYVTSLLAPDNKPLDATFVLYYKDSRWMLAGSGTGFWVDGGIDPSFPETVRHYLETGL